MKYHFDHGLRLNTEPKHKALYSWAINEVDALGKQIGLDQIPWQWSLYFTAKSCALRDSLEIEPPFSLPGEEPPAPAETRQRQIIRVQLRPGFHRDDEDYSRDTTYSMFGTKRAIKDFQLDIHAIAETDKQETCSAWGFVSNTAEIEFRDVTDPDCVGFYLFVKPETFARYVAKVSQGLIDELIFSVGSVDGFYSEWSPETSTRGVKVLTSDKEHKVGMPADEQIKPPRLGRVGSAALYINRRIEFSDASSATPVLEEVESSEPKRAIREQPAPATDVLQVLKSLRRVAWIIVSLLGLIFVVLLNR